MRSIDVSDLEDRLAADNPWWQADYNTAPTVNSILRCAVETIQNRCKAGLPTLVTGPRNSGKSTILLQIAHFAMEHGLDGQAVLFLRADGLLNDGGYFAETIALFCQKHVGTPALRPLILIDDIHCLPEWESLLEETSLRYPIARLVVTSAAPPLLASPSFERVHLPPLTFYEFMQCRDRIDGAQVAYDGAQEAIAVSSMDRVNAAFVDYLNMGGMAETAFSGGKSIELMFYGRQTYLDGVLRQHLPILFGINNPQELQSVFQILVHNAGEEISIERLSELGGVAKNTIRKYLDYFDATFQLQRLDKFDPVNGPFARARNFKLYMTDPSAQAALFGPIDGGPESKRVVEAALLSAALLKSSGTELFYGIWKGREIPFIARSGPSQEKNCAYFYLDWEAVEDTPPEQFAAHAALPSEALGPDPYIEIFTRSLSGGATFDGTKIRFTPAALYCWEMGRQAALDWPVR